jgi:hypothetical protein
MLRDGPARQVAAGLLQDGALDAVATLDVAVQDENQSMNRNLLTI